MGWKGSEIEMPVGMIFKRMFCHKCGARLKKEKITKKKLIGNLGRMTYEYLKIK